MLEIFFGTQKKRGNFYGEKENEIMEKNINCCERNSGDICNSYCTKHDNYQIIVWQGRGLPKFKQLLCENNI